jgi:hypothetical protein
MKLTTTFPLERYDILSLRLRMPQGVFETRQSYYDRSPLGCAEKMKVVVGTGKS